MNNVQLIVRDEQLCCACVLCNRPAWISLDQFSALLANLRDVLYRKYYTGPVICSQCLNPTLLPFVTGSHAYGTPRLDSDIDLVVYGSMHTLDALATQHESARPKHPGEQYHDMLRSGCLYFGRLNLIFITDTKLFDAWRAATEWLTRRKPVDREYAIRVHRRFREVI
jgi:hypothetical protein